MKKDTVLTLVDALYFAAKWGVNFSTTEAPLVFTTPSGVVSAPAFEKVSSFRAATGNGWRSVTIPYAGYRVAMTLIVPDPGAFDTVQASLDPALLQSALNGQDTVLRLRMPKFSIDSGNGLKDVLTSLGAGELFEWTEWPELSDRLMRVGDVVHQAVIDTDEKGTVAAAATGVTVEAASAFGGDIPDLTVDRPFVFVIHDLTTGAPLFLGRVLDPTG